jgi:hypothetical protein
MSPWLYRIIRAECDVRQQRSGGRRVVLWRRCAPEDRAVFEAPQVERAQRTVHANDCAPRVDRGT